MVGLEEKNNKDERVVEFEVMPAVKRTRADHIKEPMEEKEKPQRANRESSKEDEGPSKRHKRVKRPRRKITIEDFARKGAGIV